MGRHCPSYPQALLAMAASGLGWMVYQISPLRKPSGLPPHRPLMSRISVMITSISSRFRRRSVISRRPSRTGARPGRCSAVAAGGELAADELAQVIAWQGRQLEHLLGALVARQRRPDVRYERNQPTGVKAAAVAAGSRQ